jgi:hypothetical protein
MAIAIGIEVRLELGKRLDGRRFIGGYPGCFRSRLAFELGAALSAPGIWSKERVSIIDRDMFESLEPDIMAAFHYPIPPVAKSQAGIQMAFL